MPHRFIVEQTEHLVQGAMYRIRVRIPGVFLTPRESVMKFIDLKNDPIAGQTLIFSARPRLGTQEVQWKHVIEIQQVPDDSLVYVSWKVSSKRPPEKWKYER